MSPVFKKSLALLLSAITLSVRTRASPLPTNPVNEFEQRDDTSQVTALGDKGWYLFPKVSEGFGQTPNRYNSNGGLRAGPDGSCIPSISPTGTWDGFGLPAKITDCTAFYFFESHDCSFIAGTGPGEGPLRVIGKHDDPDTEIEQVKVYYLSDGPDGYAPNGVGSYMKMTLVDDECNAPASR